MRVRIHRGTKQIGGTCVELQQYERRLVLDFGLPLDGQPHDKSLVPQLALDDIDAIVISHPHIDHYGLIHHVPAETPVAMGAAARRIVSTAAPFTGQVLPSLAGPVLSHEKSLKFGPFTITPFLVDC